MTARVRLVVFLEVLFALLGFSAIVTEIATLHAQHRFAAGDFFSYFTVEANSLAVLSLLLGAFALAAGARDRRLDLYRGAVTFFMTTTIIIFIVLLSGYPASELTAVPWDNTVLHYVMPIAIIADWLLANRVLPVPFRQAVGWLLFPLGYLVYSLIRGSIVGWYPYPFMDPSTHGYLGVAVTSVVIAIALTAICWLVGLAPRVPLPGRSRSGVG